MSFEIFPSPAQISSSYRGILLDAYGVFWGGNAFGPLPGAKEVMAEWVLQGKVVGILSNSTQLAPKEISKIEAHGILLGKHFHFFITSGELVRGVLLEQALPFKTPRNTFCLLGNPHPRFSSHERLFEKTVYRETSDISEADFLYISTPHLHGEDQVDPKLFQKEVEKIAEKKLPALCPNPDLFAHEGNPPKAVVRQGSIAALYEQMGGEVFYFGKPHSIAYTAALKRFQEYGITALKEILMIGDTPETDIRGAKNAGIPSALLTQTGIMADRIQRYGQQTALKSLSPQDLPEYLIEHL